MYYPSFNEFVKLSRQGNLIPVYREFIADLETPVSAFMKINTGKYSYLLESVEGQEKTARYSFLGSGPSLVFKSKGRSVEILRAGKRGFQRSVFSAVSGPLEEIRNIIRQYAFVPVKGLPRFCGGLVGYLGYDAVRYFETIPDKNPDTLDLPDAVFMLTDTILIFDHIEHNIKIVSNVHTGNGRRRQSRKELRRLYKEARNKIERIVRRLQKPLPRNKPARTPAKLRVHSNMSEKDFSRAVNRAKEYIRAGDVIQVVLSQRFSAPVNIPDFNLYRALRIVNPSPYMFYLKLDSFKLIGASPEIMVRCEDGRAEVRPIAGTRRRGENEEADRRLAEELLRDPKERAEHIMLVDLGRNDLGRVCRYHSVEMKELMVIERYSHVMHIVSDVQGKLLPGRDSFDVIRATFPAGTVSGAPKIRAMEIIDELESVKRGPYAGCVGYFSFSGNLDTCITIRTIIVKDGIAYVQAGAGIVADSVPAKEYQETVNKAGALMKSIEMANAEIL